MRAYMRDQFEFLGIGSGDVQATWKDVRLGVIRQYGTPSADDVLAFAEGCWAQPEREFQYVGARQLRAIGWALRQYSYVDAVWVATFVADHAEPSPLSRREAMKAINRTR